MKTIGLVGGVGWQSTLDYYRIINQLVNEKAGGLHSAKIIINSVDFHDIDSHAKSGNWDLIGEIMLDAGRALKRAGAELLLLGANTMHKFADEIEQELSIPLINIGEVTGKAIAEKSLRKVGLLGTKYTMTGDFFYNALEKFDIQAVAPDNTDQKIVHDVIFDELMHGRVNQSSSQKYCQIIDKMKNEGAEGVILGCTEIPPLLHEAKLPFASFNTTFLHSKAAVEFALQ